jgi:hypothetical protein
MARLLTLALLPASVAGLGSAGVAVRAVANDSGCNLSANGNIQHVINIVFDNTHFRRDRPDVPSDLEQMPTLLNFLTTNGTLFTNDHTIMISHTAGGILSSLTGLYPDRQGQTVSNSYFYFDSAGTPRFSSSFKYWTDLVDDNPPAGTAPRDPLPNMVTDGQKTTPAPWVPYTRAGCNFGGVGTANIELENTGTGAFGDMTQAFGAGSPEWNEAFASNAAPRGTAARAQALTDFVGIAIHCAQGGGLCAKPANIGNARADALPDEPGGYAGFQALFGAKYVNPAVTGGEAAVNDLNGQPITDPFGQPGFPGFDAMLAKNTLGYVAQLQENGVPVTYAYISDAHDNHDLSRSSGPGEADYKAQLAAYDAAFGTFFARLAADGITKSNTLFVLTSDEGDHFAGGNSADGTWSHGYCNVSAGATCPSNQIGEVNLNLNSVLPAGEPPFTIHFDSAPAVYVNGNPGRTSASVRQLERDVAAATVIDPYINSAPTPLTAAIADPVALKTLHMVNNDLQRTPTFAFFANPDYFIKTFNTNCPDAANSVPSCIDYHFAWSHGDIQPEIAETWLGLAGPGVRNGGVDSWTWTDHTNVRPTILALLGLKDKYVHDGRVLIEGLTGEAIPQALNADRGTILGLGAAYEQLNGSFGQFAMDVLRASTRALKSGSADDDSTYASVEAEIQDLTARRDALAGQIKAGLDAAAFNGQPISDDQANTWTDLAQSLLNQARDLAGG